MTAQFFCISAFYYDSAAAMVVDGEIVALRREERFTRKEAHPDFPENAIAYCLKEAGLRRRTWVHRFTTTLTKIRSLLKRIWLRAGGFAASVSDACGGSPNCHAATLREQFTRLPNTPLVFTTP